MILREGPHRRIRSLGGPHLRNRSLGATLWDLPHIHVHLNNPAGGATSEDPPDRTTPGIYFEFEYLGEFEFIFKMALGYESGGCGTSFDFKKPRSKKSSQCPFKVTGAGRDSPPSYYTQTDGSWQDTAVIVYGGYSEQGFGSTVTGRNICDYSARWARAPRNRTAISTMCNFYMNIFFPNARNICTYVWRRSGRNWRKRNNQSIDAYVWR